MPSAHGANLWLGGRRFATAGSQTRESTSSVRHRLPGRPPLPEVSARSRCDQGMIGVESLHVVGLPKHPFAFAVPPKNQRADQMAAVESFHGLMQPFAVVTA